MTSTPQPIPISGRALIAATGHDALDLLQKMTSNDLSGLGNNDGGVYTLWLTPQGRYLHDFFVFRSDGHLYLDVPLSQVDALLALLKKYNLRGDAGFVRQNGWQMTLQAHQEQRSFRDPRHPDLGYRVWAPGVTADDYMSYQRLRVALGIVEPSTDMKPGESLPMEFGLDTLNAISFDKGCYTGQEMTARMHNRDLVKHQVIVTDQQVEEGIVIATADNLHLMQVKR